MTEFDRIMDYQREVNKLDEMLMDTRSALGKLQYELGRVEAEMAFIKADFLDDTDEEECELGGDPVSLYYITNKDFHLIKIGISKRPRGRLYDLQTASGSALELLHEIEFPDRKSAMEAERFLHKTFSLYRKKPSKIRKSTEWFDDCIVNDLMASYATKEQIQAALEDDWKKGRALADIIERAIYARQ